MPSCVDASVHDMKLTSLNPRVDGASSDTQREKLSPRHETVLSLSQPGDHPISSLFHPRSFPRVPPLAHE